jgi:hypothetical protein
MRTIVLTLLVLVLSTAAATAEMVGAVLIADDSECNSDHMVFSNNTGFINAEWFGGLFMEGKLYFGEFGSFGMTDVHDEDGDYVGRVWVDDFWVSNQDATEFCYQD